MPTVKIWGVQGSCPGTFYKDNFGSNTSCVSIENNHTLLILDSGTGIRFLSEKTDFDKFKDVILLITHSHWDHIQGFPFFRYIYQNKKLTIYSHLKKHTDFLINQINGENFPVDKKDLLCHFEIINDLNKINQMVDFNIKTIATNHHGDCIGYRIKFKDADITYIPDNQLHNTSTTNYEEFVEFCKNSSLLIHDAQYTSKDMPYKVDWGHSIYTDALKLAIDANVKQFGLFHHDPNRPKKEIIKMVNNCKKMTDKINIFATAEGLEIDLLGT